jgi:hypothetical protein
VTAAIHKTRLRFLTLTASLIVAVLLAAVRQVNGPACYRVHRRAAAARHSVLTRQGRHAGDGSWYPVPLRNVDLAFFANRGLSLITRAVQLILRFHRIAFVPLPARRLKLPPTHNDPF